MDFVTLVGQSTTAGSVANWLNHNAISTSGTQIVQEAESWIYRRLRHWKMLGTATGTMTTSQASVTIPSDFLEDKTWYITGVNQNKLMRKTIQEVIAAWNYDGNGNRILSPPNIFTNDSTNFVLDSLCDQNYPYLIYYYQQPAALSTANTTNFLTTTYPRLVRAATCAAGAEFMKDAGLGNYDRTYWDQMAQNEIDAAQAESDKSQRSIEQGMILA